MFSVYSEWFFFLNFFRGLNDNNLSKEQKGQQYKNCFDNDLMDIKDMRLLCGLS